MSAFYLGGEGGGGTVLVPIETIEFRAEEAAVFALGADVAAFEVSDVRPAFDFIGEPEFEPIGKDADFDVKC